jgi:BMFP domain-containing protein YqiC
MIDLRIIDELTRKLGEAFPPGVTQAKDELENQFRTVLTGAFERMNLVGREEYDAQCAVLEDTRARLEALENRLDEL